ncbi:fibronectin type III domain-containing protein [Curtobacterium sp. NPDC098951]|uniref:fibronectin type III domain-containing protein n=1 Tax=Curtobacterium sp. NPDC098951 TaxID=3363974 RepID=UPI0037F51098
MFRAVVTAAAAVALVIGGAAPATAAPSSVPGAPTSVRVTGAADSATVTWGRPGSGAKVTGWRVTVSPAEQQPDGGVDRLPATARSDRFGDLTASTTYTFSVRAVGSRGAGKAVSVRYTAPGSVRTVQSLYALDGTGSVVRFPVSGTGAPTTIAPNGAGFTADDVGDVFVPSGDRTSIVMYPAGGAAPRTVATGLHLGADLRSDVAGNLYWVDSSTGAITKLPVTGAAPRAIIPSAGTGWAVGRDGTVSAVTFGRAGADSTVVSVSPSGARTTRSFPETGYRVFAGVLADGHGNLYLNYTATGASGASGWVLLAAGSSTLTAADDRLAFDYAATTTRSLLIAKSAEWCAAPADSSPTGCSADKTITSVVSRNADGSVAERVTSGVKAQGRGLWIGAADEAGDLFIDVRAGATPGLWRLDAAGGVAQRLSAGAFTRLLVI